MKYDFENPDHFAQLERQAFSGSINVEGFPPAAYRYFDSLRRLYERYRFEGLSKDDASAIKRKLLKEYTIAKEDREHYVSAAKEHQESLRMAGRLLADIEKAQTAEEIAEYACRVIEGLTGEKGFAERQIRKIREELKNERNIIQSADT